LRLGRSPAPGAFTPDLVDLVLAALRIVPHAVPRTPWPVGPTRPFVRSTRASVRHCGVGIAQNPSMHWMPVVDPQQSLLWEHLFVSDTQPAGGAPQMRPASVGPQ